MEQENKQQVLLNSEPNEPTKPAGDFSSVLTRWMNLWSHALDRELNEKKLAAYALMLNHIHPTELDRACKDLSPITTFPAPGDINRAWLEPHAKAALDSVFKFISEWGTNPVRRIKARLQPFGETDPRGKEGITLDYELPPAFDPVTAAAILSAGGLDAIARSQETEKSFYFTQSHWVKNYIQAATESARKSRLEGERL